MTEPRHHRDANGQRLPAEFERRLTIALETPPPVYIPGDFAARVALAGVALESQSPAPRDTARTSPHFGRFAAWAGFALLLVAMLVLSAAAPQSSTVALLVQSLLALEFVLLVLVSTLRPRLLG